MIFALFSFAFLVKKIELFIFRTWFSLQRFSALVCGFSHPINDIFDHSVSFL